MIRVLVLVSIAITLPAAARNADGTLAVIEYPNCGAPAMVTPGGAFSVRLREKAELFLVSEKTRLPLETRWTGREWGLPTGRCRLPGDLIPGDYTLEAVTPGATDANRGVVHVVENFPDTYTIAQIGALDLRGDDEASFTRVRTLLEKAQAAGAVFAVITGGLASEETAGIYRPIVQLLSTAPIPVFTCPETAASPVAATFWGRGGYVFRFGADGYLAFDTTGPFPADENGPQAAWLYRVRRRIRDSRWSIGLTQYYSHAMGIRAQLTLLVDDPLDALLSSTVPSYEGHPLSTAPWGHTALFPLPPGTSGIPWRLLRIGAGIHEIAVPLSKPAPKSE